MMSESDCLYSLLSSFSMFFLIFLDFFFCLDFMEVQVGVSAKKECEEQVVGSEKNACNY